MMPRRNRRSSWHPPLPNYLTRDLPVSRERPPERAMAMRTTGTEGRERDPFSAETDLRDTGTTSPSKETR